MLSTHLNLVSVTVNIILHITERYNGSIPEEKVKSDMNMIKKVTDKSKRNY